MHYDLTRSFWEGHQGFDWDPTLEVLDCANLLTVITIKPSLERLIAQHIWRRFGVLSRAEISPTSTRPNSRGLDLLGRYEEPGWANQWYDAWDATISSASSRSEIATFKIEPDGASPVGETLRWCIVEDGGGELPARSQAPHDVRGELDID
jgi:hypothetical protein